MTRCVHVVPDGVCVCHAPIMRYGSASGNTLPRLVRENRPTVHAPQCGVSALWIFDLQLAAQLPQRLQVPVNLPTAAAGDLPQLRDCQSGAAE